MLPELSFYKATIDKGSHGILDTLDLDFAPEDEDICIARGKTRGRPRGRGKRGADDHMRNDHQYEMIICVK